MRDRYHSRLGTRTEPERKLWAFIDAHLATGDDADPDAVACWVQIAAEAVRKSEVGALYQRVVADELDTLDEIVRETLREQGLSTRPARGIAAAIYAAIQGAYQLGVAAPNALPPGSAARSVRAMARGLLEAKGWQS
jgi:TetR/AcrR family transcriptional repressor of bet genes